jgi:hypothetical protein
MKITVVQIVPISCSNTCISTTKNNKQNHNSITSRLSTCITLIICTTMAFLSSKHRLFLSIYYINQSLGIKSIIQSTDYNLNGQLYYSRQKNSRVNCNGSTNVKKSQYIQNISKSGFSTVENYIING